MLRGGEWVAIVAIGAWASMMFYRMYLVGKTRDHAHRERLAMIERGLVPPAESDPKQFERMTDWDGSFSGNAGARSRRTGIILIGVGLGLSAMFYVMGITRAIGSGAFLVIMGLAFLVSSMFEARSPRDQPPRT